MILYILLLCSAINACCSYSAAYDEEQIKTFLINRTPPKDHAKIARTLVHKSKWAATGTLSTTAGMEGLPMVNIISIADSGENEPSTGNIYFLLTLLDFTGQDVYRDNKITFMISNDEDLSCTNDNNTDPMEPTCARVILSGKVVWLKNGTKEFSFAHRSFISRHPAAINWEKAHHFFLCKLDINNIFVLDGYGGPHIVPVDEYYKATPDEFDISQNEISQYKPSPAKRELHIKIHKDKYKYIKIEI